MNDSPTHAPAAPPESTASRWEDLVDIFYAPRGVFRRRRDGRFVGPLVVLALSVLVLVLAHQQALAPVYDAQFAQAAMEMQDAGIDAAAAQRILPLMAAVGAIIMFPIGVVILGLALWLLGKLFGAAAGFSLAMVVATFSQFPRLAQYVIEIVQGIVLDQHAIDSLYGLAIGPARFLDPDTGSGAMLALAARMDLFTLWATILVAIGATLAMRLKVAAGIAVAVIVWMLGTGAALLQAGLS